MRKTRETYLETGSVGHSLLLCDLKKKVNICECWTWMLDLTVDRSPSHLAGHAHGTRDVDAEEQQGFCCLWLFFRME